MGKILTDFFFGTISNQVFLSLWWDFNKNKFRKNHTSENICAVTFRRKLHF